MPSRRRGGGSHRRNRASGAMSSCNLPGDIVVDILSRLPVKSLMRFRCVCKPWLVLFTNPRFIAMHLHRATLNPNIIVHSCLERSADHVVSLFRTDSLEHAINLDHPFPICFLKMDVVGSFNGLVCMCNPPYGQLISIWNPATRQYKDLPPYKIWAVEDGDEVSVGFGFDSVADDYKVVRIAYLEREGKKLFPSQVEVYSANEDSWKQIDVDVPFNVFRINCEAIVKGVPYWVAAAKGGEGSELWEVLIVSFDVRNEVFRQLSPPKFPQHGGTLTRAVELRESLAVMVYSPHEESNKCVDVWTMDGDGGEKVPWTKKVTVGPILGVARPMWCLKNGEIVAENAESVLFVFDPKSKEVKNVRTPVDARTFGVFNYTESLVSIRGFQQVGKEAKKERSNRYR